VKTITALKNELDYSKKNEKKAFTVEEEVRK